MQTTALRISLKFLRQCDVGLRHGFISLPITCSSYDQSGLKNSVNLSPSLSWPARSWSSSFPSSKVSPWPGALLASDSGKVGAASVRESAGEDAEAVGLEIHEKDLESEERLLDLYERWRRFYGVNRGVKEMNFRFKVFKDSVEYIYRFNQMDMGYELGLNQFTDLTPGEVVAGYTGLRRDTKLRHGYGECDNPSNGAGHGEP